MKDWKNNKAYQKKQQLRSTTLQSKPGYEENIARGVKEKAEAKKQRDKRRAVRLSKRESTK